jgi:hypothetical protein
MEDLIRETEKLLLRINAHDGYWKDIFSFQHYGPLSFLGYLCYESLYEYADEKYSDEKYNDERYKGKISEKMLKEMINKDSVAVKKLLSKNIGNIINEHYLDYIYDLSLIHI